MTNGVWQALKHSHSTGADAEQNTSGLKKKSTKQSLD